MLTYNYYYELLVYLAFSGEAAGTPSMLPLDPVFLLVYSCYEPSLSYFKHFCPLLATNFQSSTPEDTKKDLLRSMFLIIHTISFGQYFTLIKRKVQDKVIYEPRNNDRPAT